MVLGDISGFPRRTGWSSFSSKCWWGPFKRE